MGEKFAIFISRSHWNEFVMEVFIVAIVQSTQIWNSQMCSST